MKPTLTPAAVFGSRVPGEKQLTDDAIVASWLKHWSQPPTRAEYALSISTAIESWPNRVMDLSFRSRGIQLTHAQRDWLAGIAGECSPRSGLTEPQANARFAEIAQHPMFEEIAGIAQAVIGQFKEPPFFKFGTRSPKDSPFFCDFNGRVPNGGAVICNIATSWRAFEDLAISQVQAGGTGVIISGLRNVLNAALRAPEQPCAIDHPPWLWFREYAQWEPWQEFRCFMRDGRFAGATQYYGVDPKVGPLAVYPQLVDSGPFYETAIIEFFHNRFAPAVEDYLRSCVFDVVVDLEADSVHLIEINPARPTTFPGLKDWHRPETFNGELDWLADEVPRVIVGAEGVRHG
jgi:hypothetical protein